MWNLALSMVLKLSDQPWYVIQLLVGLAELSWSGILISPERVCESMGVWSVLEDLVNCWRLKRFTVCGMKSQNVPFVYFDINDVLLLFFFDMYVVIVVVIISSRSSEQFKNDVWIEELHFVVFLLRFSYQLWIKKTTTNRRTNGRTNIGQALSHETPDGRRDEFILFYFITTVSNISGRGW